MYSFRAIHDRLSYTFFLKYRSPLCSLYKFSPLVRSGYLSIWTCLDFYSLCPQMYSPPCPCYIPTSYDLRYGCYEKRGIWEHCEDNLRPVSLLVFHHRDFFSLWLRHLPPPLKPPPSLPPRVRVRLRFYILGVTGKFKYPPVVYNARKKNSWGDVPLFVIYRHLSINVNFVNASGEKS